MTTTRVPMIAAARWAVVTAEFGLLATLVLFPSGGIAGIAARATLVIAGGAGALAVPLLGGLPWRRHSAVVAALSFLIVCELTAVLSEVPAASAAGTTKTLLRLVVVALLLFCAVPERNGDSAMARRIALALVGGGLLLAATGWELWLAGHQTHWGGLEGPMHYNVVCMVLVPILSLALAFFVSKPSWWWFAVCTTLLITALMTFSRIGWAALATLFVLWFMAAPHGRRWRLTAIAVFGILLALMAAGSNISHLGTVVDNDVLLLKDPSTELDGEVMKSMSIKDLLTLNDRLAYAWKPALQLATERPLLGWGYGEQTFTHLTRGHGPMLGHEHNGVLAVAVQSGLIGVTAWLAWLGILIWRGWLSRQLDEHDLNRWLLTGVAIAVVAEYLVQGLGEAVGNYRMAVLLMMLTGITVYADNPPVSWLRPRR